MGIVFRQSIKATIVTLTGAVLGALVVFFSSKALIPVSRYGLITNITMAAAIIQLMVILGGANLVLVYTQRYDAGGTRRKALLTLAMLVAIVGTAIFTVAYFLLKQDILQLYNAEDQVLINKYYYLLPILVLMWGITTILEQYLISQVKIAIPAFTREIVLRSLNLALLGLVFTGLFTFRQYVFGYICIYAVPLAVLSIVSSRTKGFGFTTNLNVFSMAEYKDMLHFSWYHLLMGVSMTMLHFIDTLLLGPLDSDGIKASAIYGVATFIAAISYMPYRAMANSSTPILNEAYIQKDNEKVSGLFTRAGVNIFIAAIGMFLLIGFNLHNAVAILPVQYAPIQYLVWILMLGKVIDMATGMNNELISISKYYKFNFRIAAFLLVMVFVLDRIFIPEYGVYGAAWVATFSVTMFNVAKMVFLYMKMKLHPFTRRTWLVLVAGAAAALGGYLLPYMVNPFVDTIIRGAIILIIYGLMLVWLKPSRDLIDFLQNIAKNKRLF